MKLNEKRVSTLVGGVEKGNEEFVQEIKDEIRSQLQEEMEPNVFQRNWPLSKYRKEIKERNAHVDLITAGEATELLSETSKNAFKGAVLADNDMKIKPNTLQDTIIDEEEKKRYVSQMNFIRDYGTDNKKDFKALTDFVKDKTAEQTTSAKEYIDKYKSSDKSPDKDYAKGLVKTDIGREVLELAAKQPDNVKKVEELERGANDFKLSTGQHLKVVKMCASAESPEGAEARHNFMHSECSRGRAGKFLGSLTGDLYKNKELTIMADKLAEFDKDKTKIPDPFAKGVNQMDKQDRADAALAIVAKYPNVYNAMSEAYGKDMTNRQLVSAVKQMGERAGQDLMLVDGKDIEVSKNPKLGKKADEKIRQDINEKAPSLEVLNKFSEKALQELDASLAKPNAKAAFVSALNEAGDVSKNRDNLKMETIIPALEAAKTASKISVGQYDVAPRPAPSIGQYDVAPSVSVGQYAPAPSISRASSVSNLTSPLEGNATTPPFGGINRPRANSAPEQIYGSLSLTEPAGSRDAVDNTYSPIPAIAQPGRGRAQSAPEPFVEQPYGAIPAVADPAVGHYRTPQRDAGQTGPVPEQYSNIPAMQQAEYTNIPVPPQAGYGGVPSPINKIPEAIAVDARSAQYGAPKHVTGVDVELQKPTRPVPQSGRPERMSDMVWESNQKAAAALAPATRGNPAPLGRPSNFGGDLSNASMPTPDNARAPGHVVAKGTGAAIQ